MEDGSTGQPYPVCDLFLIRQPESGLLEQFPIDRVIVHHPDFPVTFILAFQQFMDHLLEYVFSKGIVKVEHIVGGISIKFGCVGLDAVRI